MKQIAGIYLPDGEAELPGYLQNSGGSYQSRQLLRSLEFVTNWELAIDVGAHVGLWSLELVKRFARVVAFEPMPPLRACLEKNVVSPKLQVVPIALGNTHGAVSFDYNEAHTGATHVDLARPGIVPLGMLDDFRLTGVGYIKIDTEGYEIDVLEGAREMLAASMPVVIVEEKLHGVKHYGKKAYAAIEFLQSLGAKVLDRVVDDFIMGWPDVPGKVRLEGMTRAARPQAAPAAKSPDAQLPSIVARHNAGDVAGAISGYEQILATAPAHAETLNMLAIAQLQTGQAEAALASSQRAANLAPAEARYVNTLGTCLWMNDRHDEAEATIAHAASLDPRLAEAQTNLGEIRLSQGRLSEAADCFGQALRIKPDAAELFVKLARIQIATGAREQAAALYRQALALRPDLAEAKAELAKLADGHAQDQFAA